MKQREEEFPPVPSPLRLFLKVLAVIFIAEAAVMFLLQVWLPDLHLHPLAESIADPVMMVVLGAPFLWWFLVRPLRRIAVAEHVRAATVIRHARDGIISMNEQGLIESFNPTAEHIFGYRAEEVVGKPLTLLMPERYRDQHQPGVERVRAARTSDVLEGRMLEAHGLRKDGTEFPLECSVAGWTTGKEMLFVGIVRDITERKRAEEQLRIQSTALAAAANGVVITDREGRIIWVNPAFTRITGYTPEEAIGQTPRLLKSGKHDQAFYQNLWETILAGQMWHSDVINRRKDGGLYTDHQIISPLRDASGAISHFVTIKEDITERKRSEEALARRMREMEALNRIGTVASSSLGLNDVLNNALDVILATLGMDAGEIFLLDEERGEVVLALHRGAFPEAFWEVSRFKLGEGFPGRVAQIGENLVTTDLARELRFLRKEVIESGFRTLAPVPFKARGKVIGTLDVATRGPRDLTAADLQILTSIGAVIGMAVANARMYEDLRLATKYLEARVEDRTRDLQAANLELEEALRQLEEASRNKSEFLANMSHELRTPLNSILGFSEFLREQAIGPLTEKQARYVNHIHNSGQHLLALINGLLDLSKVEAGKLELRPQPFEVRESLAAALREVRPQVEAKSLGLDLYVDEGIPSLTADPVRFKQILLNLLSNAIKFSPGGGRVTVRARRVPAIADLGLQIGDLKDTGPTLQSEIANLQSEIPGDVLEIAVTDTGIGIKPEDLPKLFQPFTQLEPAYAKQYQGTGLGLALTKRLVELHGGMIWAESQGEGCGTTFTVQLPLAPPVA